MKKDNSDYRGIYSEMVEVFGEEIVKMIHKHYKGQQITFPMKLNSNEYVNKYIAQNYKVKNLREMARELGYSDRWVKRLINKMKTEE